MASMILWGSINASIHQICGTMPYQNIGAVFFKFLKSQHHIEVENHKDTILASFSIAYLVGSFSPSQTCLGVGVTTQLKIFVPLIIFPHHEHVWQSVETKHYFTPKKKKLPLESCEKIRVKTHHWNHLFLCSSREAIALWNSGAMFFLGKKNIQRRITKIVWSRKIQA